MSEHASPPIASVVAGDNIPEEAALDAAVKRMFALGELGRWRELVGARQEAYASYHAVEAAVRAGAEPAKIVELLKARSQARSEEELTVRRKFAPPPDSHAEDGAKGRPL